MKYALIKSIRNTESLTKSIQKYRIRLAELMLIIQWPCKRFQFRYRDVNVLTGVAFLTCRGREFQMAAQEYMNDLRKSKCIGQLRVSFYSLCSGLLSSGETRLVPLLSGDFYRNCSDILSLWILGNDNRESWLFIDLTLCGPKLGCLDGTLCKGGSLVLK